MLGVKINLKDAQKLKEFIISNNLIDKRYKVIKEKDAIIFPLVDLQNLKKDLTKKFPKAQVSEFKFVELIKSDFKNELKEKLTKEEIEKLKTAFDTIGDIAIMEIDSELESKEKLIAEFILKQNKTIKTVLKKSGHHKGEFRTQDMEYVLGENKKIANYRENNCIMQLDVEKVYFSPRLSTERKRIAQLVKPNEEILVMFCGAAPYVCVLSKNTQAKSVLGIELNPEGHKWGEVNIKLNKLKNAKLINGDVKLVAPKLNQKFDRILMPLPKSAEDFLDAALVVSKKGTIIHFYDFLHEKDIFVVAIKKIDDACKRNNKKYKIVESVKCGQHAPRTFRVCVDFEVLND